MKTNAILHMKYSECFIIKNGLNTSPKSYMLKVKYNRDYDTGRNK